MLSVLINTHMLMAARAAGVERFFYSSSACVYAAEHADRPRRYRTAGRGCIPRHAGGRLRLGKAVQRAHVPPLPGGLRPAHPGGPVSQRVRPQRHLRRRAREGAGRDLPQSGRGQALRQTTGSRSGATASRPGRSCTSDDCVHGSQALADSDVIEPINLGSSELVTINELVSIVEEIAGVELRREYKLDAPQGVRGRNSDNTRILELLGWEPSISLREGLEQTYRWVHDQMAAGERSMMVP